MALGEAGGLDGLDGSGVATKSPVGNLSYQGEIPTNLNTRPFNPHIPTPFFNIILPQLALGHKRSNLLTKTPSPSVLVGSGILFVKSYNSLDKRTVITVLKLSEVCIHQRRP